MEKQLHALCVFCGSNTGSDAAYSETARALARAIARAGMHLVYGGGSIGLMGVLADAALAAGCTVIGVVPRRLLGREVVHRGLAELRVVETMLERKALMAELSDAFVALPGGFGTLDELFEMLTWTQLGFQQKPCALLNVGGYFDRLTGFLDHAVAQRFVTREHRDMLLVDDDPDRVIQRLKTAPLPQVSKWVAPPAP
jgi:uncharacterized protein (TIGR00730 family)